MNATLQEIAFDASKRISQIAKADKEFVSLSIGEPWFGPVPNAIKILSSLSDSELSSVSHWLSHYVKGNGEYRLREAVAARYAKRFGTRIDPEKNVIITHGGSQAFLLALLAITEEGDEVVVPDPTYMLYANTCTLLGRLPVRTPKSVQDGFILLPDALGHSLTSRTRMVVLNSPENPTGVVYTRAELKELYDICDRAGVVLLQDEVYDNFVFEGEHWSCTAFDPSLSHSIQLNSMSKAYGLPGLRIGWLIANERTILAASKALEYTSLSVCGLSHYLAEKVLLDAEVEKWLLDVRDGVHKRRDILLDGLRPMGFEFPPRGGCGGFYLFPKVPHLTQMIDGAPNHAEGDYFAEWIARTAKIAVVPGSVYGSQGRDHIRVVTTGEISDLELAISRFAKVLVSNELIHA